MWCWGWSWRHPLGGHWACRPLPFSSPGPSPHIGSNTPPLHFSPAPSSLPKQTQAVPAALTSCRPWSSWLSPCHGSPSTLPHIDSSRRDHTCTPTCMPRAHAQDVWTPQRVCTCVDVCRCPEPLLAATFILCGLNFPLSLVAVLTVAAHHGPTCSV